MEELIPSEFFLSQNFPNPFKDRTQIKYCLPVKTKVNLSVFNSDGEKVKELVNKIQEAGTYEIEFDSHSGESAIGGRNLPAGNYYYRIQAVDPLKSSGQSFVEAKKMLLLK